MCVFGVSKIPSTYELVIPQVQYDLINPNYLIDKHHKYVRYQNEMKYALCVQIIGFLLGVSLCQL
jgi:hypothetical protein